MNLPLVCLTEACVFSVGGMIGEVLAIDLEGVVPRIRVNIDTSKPINRGIRVFLEALNQEFTLPIQYEKLPDFCFGCSMIGHRVCDCPTYFNIGLSDSPRRFGEWLRATNSAPKRKSSRQISTSATSSHTKQTSEPSVAQGEHSKDQSCSQNHLESRLRDVGPSPIKIGTLNFDEVAHGNLPNSMDPQPLNVSNSHLEISPDPFLNETVSDTLVISNLVSTGELVSDLELSEVVIGVATSPIKESRSTKGKTWKRKQSLKGLKYLGPVKGFLLHSSPKSKSKSTCGKSQQCKRKLPMSILREHESLKKPKSDDACPTEEMGFSCYKSASPALQGRRTQ